MAIASAELVLNKVKCHALERRRKVSCAASQQGRRAFDVFAKRQLRNARRGHKAGTALVYPTLNFRRLLIRVLCSH